jgi:hypothetical protein
MMRRKRKTRRKNKTTKWFAPQPVSKTNVQFNKLIYPNYKRTLRSVIEKLLQVGAKPFTIRLKLEY